MSANSGNNTGDSVAKFKNPSFVSRDVNNYVLKFGLREPDEAKHLRLKTAAHSRAVMMGDPVEAALFRVLLPAIGAERAIEVGVFTGYTTLQLAQAVGPSGKVVALDVNDEYAKVGKPHWTKLGVADRIDLRIGPAVESLRKLAEDEEQLGSYDFAFIDADKVHYMQYYELLLRLVRKNGIIALDNVLWYGKVLDDEQQDEDTLALKEINKFILNDDRVEHVMLPFADGVTLVRKK